MVYIILISAFCILSLLFKALDTFTSYRIYVFSIESQREKLKRTKTIFLIISSVFVAGALVCYINLKPITPMAILVFATFVINRIIDCFDFFFISKAFNIKKGKDIFYSVVINVSSIIVAAMLIFIPLVMSNLPSDLSEYTLEETSQTEKIVIAEDEKILSASVKGSKKAKTDGKETVFYLVNSSEEDCAVSFYSYDNPFTQEMMPHELDKDEFNINKVEGLEHPYYIKKTYYYSYVSPIDPTFKKNKRVELYELYVGEDDLTTKDVSA